MYVTFVLQCYLFLLDNLYSQIFVITALQSLWGQGDFKQEMDEMLAEQAAIEAAPPTTSLQLLRDRTVRWQLLSMSLIYCCNQLSGMSAVRTIPKWLWIQQIPKNWHYGLSKTQKLNASLLNSQISTFSFDIFLKAGIPRDKIRYVTLGLGVSEIVTSISCVSNPLSVYLSSLTPNFHLPNGTGCLFFMWTIFLVLPPGKEPLVSISAFQTATTCFNSFLKMSFLCLCFTFWICVLLCAWFPGEYVGKCYMCSLFYDRNPVNSTYSNSTFLSIRVC